MQSSQQIGTFWPAFVRMATISVPPTVVNIIRDDIAVEFLHLTHPVAVADMIHIPQSCISYLSCQPISENNEGVEKKTKKVCLKVL